MLAGGQSPPRLPPKRSFVTFDRGGQTGPPRSNDFLFGAADDTRAADDRPAGRPAERLAERPAERQAEFLGFRVFGTVIGPLRFKLPRAFSPSFLPPICPTSVSISIFMEAAMIMFY